MDEGLGLGIVKVYLLWHSQTLPLVMEERMRERETARERERERERERGGGDRQTAIHTEEQNRHTNR